MLYNYINLKSVECLNDAQINVILSALVSRLIKLIFVHPVKYEHIFSEFNLNDIDHDLVNIKKEISQDKYDDIVEECKNLDWNCHIFKNVDSFLMTSNKTENFHSEHYAKINLPEEDFELYLEFDYGLITIKTFVEGIYRLKLSKYDWSHEFFNGIKVKFNPDETEGNFIGLKCDIDFVYK